MSSKWHWEEKETMLKIFFISNEKMSSAELGGRIEANTIKDPILSYLNPNASVTFRTSFSTNLHTQSINSSAVVVDYFPDSPSFLHPCYDHYSLWPQHLSTITKSSLGIPVSKQTLSNSFSHFYESFYPSIKNN